MEPSCAPAAPADAGGAGQQAGQWRQFTRTDGAPFWVSMFLLGVAVLRHRAINFGGRAFCQLVVDVGQAVAQLAAKLPAGKPAGVP